MAALPNLLHYAEAPEVHPKMILPTFFNHISSFSFLTYTFFLGSYYKSSCLFLHSFISIFRGFKTFSENFEKGIDI